MVCCLLGFIFNVNADYVTGQYHAWRFCERFPAFYCIKAKYCRKFFKTNIRSGKLLLASNRIRLITYCFFLSRAPASFLKRTKIFASWNVPCKTLLCPYLYVLKLSRHLLLLRGTRLIQHFSFLNCQLRWSFCGAIFFHWQKFDQVVFLASISYIPQYLPVYLTFLNICLYFLHSSILEVGHTNKHLPRASSDLCTPRLSNMFDSKQKCRESGSF